MFDPSAPHIIILLVVVLLLFGSKRLPGAASSIGKAMQNFKGEMKKMHDDDDADTVGATAQTTLPPAALQPPPVPVTPQPVLADVTQQQLGDLQRQIADLQAQNVPAGGSMGGATTPEAQPTQQPF